MATLNDIDLGSIQNEEQNKDSGIFQQTLPRSDSNEAVLLDLFGCFRTITITGIFDGTEAEQRTFIGQIDTIENGQQDSSTFVSSLITSPASYKVFIQNFVWTKSAADPSKIDYTLVLIEGEEVSV